MLDMLLREKDSPADEQSLAAWLGLPEPAPKRPPDRSASSKPGDRWPDVVQAYAEEYRSRTLSREGNESITLGRLDRIAAAFPKRHPDAGPAFGNGSTRRERVPAGTARFRASRPHKTPQTSLDNY